VAPTLRFVRLALVGACLAPVLTAGAQDDLRCKPTLAPRADGPQVADTGFNPAVAHPAYPVGRGPIVLIDEGHANFHTVDGRYAPFARFLRRDGFVVQPLRGQLTAASLAPARVLVVANATVPNVPPFIPAPSAFTAEEISVVRAWVRDGGSLFLIADHMPFGGAAARLAEAFGLLFSNAYATDEACGADEFLFTRVDGTLMDHPVIRGRNASERVDSVLTITGQAFRSVNPETSPLLVLAPRTVLLLPTQPWVFTDQTPRVPAEGMLQGAVVVVGRGRVAAFGEAAMFSAQVSGAGRRPMGMNMPEARENPQFLLNVMHWLAGLLPDH